MSSLIEKNVKLVREIISLGSKAGWLILNKIDESVLYGLMSDSSPGPSCGPKSMIFCESSKSFLMNGRYPFDTSRPIVIY